jgi:hypothetical protein
MDPPAPASAEHGLENAQRKESGQKAIDDFMHRALFGRSQQNADQHGEVAEEVQNEGEWGIRVKKGGALRGHDAILADLPGLASRRPALRMIRLPRAGRRR